jgi:hypothetical protein
MSMSSWWGGFTCGAALVVSVLVVFWAVEIAANHYEATQRCARAAGR